MNMKTEVLKLTARTVEDNSRVNFKQKKYIVEFKHIIRTIYNQAQILVFKKMWTQNQLLEVKISYKNFIRNQFHN